MIQCYLNPSSFSTKSTFLQERVEYIIEFREPIGTPTSEQQLIRALMDGDKVSFVQLLPLRFVCTDNNILGAVIIFLLTIFYLIK